MYQLKGQTEQVDSSLSKKPGALKLTMTLNNYLNALIINKLFHSTMTLKGQYVGMEAVQSPLFHWQ